MLKIYDKDHNAVGYIVKYKDLKIESDVKTGDETLSFTYLSKHHLIEEEYYVETEENEYVIKEKSVSSDGFLQFIANLNLEDLEAKPWESFSVTDTTIKDAARLALAGSGWTVGECTVSKKRNAGILQTNTLGIIRKLCTAFMCEAVYDTKKKTISFYENVGSDKGTYFLKGLNMRRLQRRGSTYDYYTRIIPVGADGLTIEEVNDGKKYLENHQYSKKIKTYIWKDESYTDAASLKEDAEKKLQDMSRPEVSYSADVVNLAKQSQKYKILDFKIGDTVTLIDAGTGIREKQRIVKMVRYPQDSSKDSCELANRQPSFEEMRQKMQEAQEIIDAVINDDGRYTGTINVSDILKFEEGLESSSSIGNLKGLYNSLDGSLSELRLVVGNIETNYISADEANLKYASIEELNATKVKVGSIEGEYSSFKNSTAENFASVNAQIIKLNTEKLTATEAELKYANIDFSNIGKAAMEYFYANSGLIKDVTVGDQTITGELIGVTIKGDLIESNTVVADKLVIKGTDGLYYKLNTDGMKTETEQTDYNSLNGKILITKSVTASKIDVKDLVAFGATIGGFKITDNSIYSGVKSSVGNTTRGIYLDKDGQASLGDSDQYIKYFRDTDGNYKLSMSIAQLVLGSSKTNVETILSDTNKLAQNANSTASAAQSTANSAKNTAESFATRISDAETKIAQNSTDISLRATKSELTTAVDGIQIGGRNLVIDSETVQVRVCGYGSNVLNISDVSPDTYSVNGRLITKASRVIFVKGSTGDVRFYKRNTNYDSIKNIYDLSNKTYIMSVWVMADADCTLASFVTRQYNDSDGSSKLHTLSANTWTRITHSRTFSSRSDLDGIRVRFTCATTVNIVFCLAKVELGTKATDWTPAPEDLASAEDLSSLTTRVTEAEADINVNANAIELRATKTELSTVSSAANKAQSTADSVKSNLANNYYTKTQSDSNLSVKSDAILASVKSTYTSKEDFNALEIGGRNLVLDSSRLVSNNIYGMTTYGITKNEGKELSNGYGYLVPGNTYTCSICITPAAKLDNVSLYVSGGYYNLCSLHTNGTTNKQVITGTFVANYYNGRYPTDNVNNGLVAVYRFPNDGSVTTNTTIHWIKIEKGNKATDWTPAPEDMATGDELGKVMTRVTETESNITQLSNKITTEVSERTALGTRVSTLEQTASGLTVRLGNTESTANTALTNANKAQNSIDNLEIGGRNLARNTSKEWANWWTPAANTQNSTFNFFNIYPGERKVGDIFTVSFDIDVKKFTAGSGGTFDIWAQGSVDSTWNIGNPFTKYGFTSKALAGDYTEHVSYTCTIDSEAQANATRFNFGFRCDYSNGTGKIRMKNFKVERGNKATDWTPAPEDTQEGISNVQNLIDTANSNASTAQATANAANSAANTALSNAANAQNTANVAKSDIDSLSKIATKTYRILGSEGRPTWLNLGTLKSYGDATNFVITVYSGGGYNGNSGQNAKAEIVIKDGWQSSYSASAAFGVSVTRQNCDTLKVKVLASAHDVCDVWLCIPWGYWDGTYTIAGSYKSWTNNLLKQDSEPTSGTAQNVAYRMNAENASTVATNYLNFSNGGLVIGNLTASTLGRNVLIDSDSVDIRNGTTVLATFAENLIELGKNSTASVIKLCGGAGKITSEKETYNGSSYNSLVLFADYVTKIKAGQGNAIITASSNGFVKLLAANGSAENYITLFTDHTYFSKKIVVPNGVALYGARTDGTESDMVHMSSSNNVILGYGSYANGVGRTHLYGNQLRFYVKTANTSYKPYYEADMEDGVSDTWVVDGYISASALRVYFTIPLGKPIIGNPTVTVSSMNGLIIRENGNYVYGSTSNTYVKPSQYIASVVGGNCIYIIAVFTDKTNAVTNHPCSVNASLAIDFS